MKFDAVPPTKANPLLTSPSSSAAKAAAPPPKRANHKRVFDRSLDRAGDGQKWKKSKTEDSFQRLDFSKCPLELSEVPISHLRKWDQFLDTLDKPEAEATLTTVNLFSKWLPKNGVTSGATGYISTIRNRLPLEVEVDINDHKAYNTVIKRSKKRLKTDFGITDADSASPFFSKDLACLGADEQALLKLFCCWGQRSVDFERAVKCGGFHKDSESVFIDNFTENKTQNAHDAEAALTKTSKRAFTLLASFGRDGGRVKGLIDKVAAARSSKADNPSLHSFRRTFALALKKYNDSLPAGEKLSLFELAAAGAPQGGWGLPSKNDPLKCKFYHYCRDASSFKQKLAIGRDDVKELLWKLFVRAV
jgi:hypothetical protein